MRWSLLSLVRAFELEVEIREDQLGQSLVGILQLLVGCHPCDIHVPPTGVAALVHRAQVRVEGKGEDGNQHRAGPFVA